MRPFAFITSLATAFTTSSARLTSFVLELRRPSDWEMIKAQVDGLNTEATIVALLATVQAQVISLASDIYPSFGGILIATNSLAFAGIFLDVITACLALLSSTIIQQHVHMVERQLKAIESLPQDRVEAVIEEFRRLGQSSEFTYPDVRRQAILRCQARLRALRSEDNTDTDTYDIYVDIYIPEVIASCQHVRSVAFIMDAAGASMLLGIICFFISALFLAIASQPPAVWAVSVVACSSILVLPRVLGVLLKMRSWN